MTWITRKGYEELYDEYMKMDEEIAQVCLQMGESANNDADLRENPEFMSLRVKAMYELPAKKRELGTLYSNALIIEDADDYINFDGETVIIGARVILDFDGDLENYVILGNREADITSNILSCEAPIAKAILGHKKGDSVKFNNLNVRIADVSLYHE